VISLLPGAAEYITAAGVPREKIIFIPNGIAQLTPAPPGPATSALADQVRRFREVNGPGAGLVAGYVGSHGAANGVDVLVRAAAVLRDRGVGDIALVLVGDGPDKQRCERLAAGLGLGSNVLFAPPVPKREVPGLLEALDVTLFPLRDVPVFRYGLSSNKLFDYLASGRPVICASALADNPVRASGGGICVRPEAPEAVADALAELAKAGPDRRRAIGEQGRAWVYRHHDMTMLGERFLRALESIAK
jgi:glycosyltransferase involved in cell wall biosynthesis